MAERECHRREWVEGERVRAEKGLRDESSHVRDEWTKKGSMDEKGKGERENEEKETRLSYIYREKPSVRDTQRYTIQGMMARGFVAKHVRSSSYLYLQVTSNYYLLLD